MSESEDSRGAVKADSRVQSQARVAIDLGAESCRVSLLRWSEDELRVDMIHRLANGPVHVDGTLRWPFDRIFEGLEEGLRKAAGAAPEGIASIAVDGWAVDYVRLGADGLPLANPFCYRDERTIASKQAVERIVPPEWTFGHAGAQPLRINTVYQLIADPASGIDPYAPWINLPEYVLYRLGGRRVAEHTNATHSGLVEISTGDWSNELFQMLGLDRAAAPPIVPAGTVIGKLSGPLARLGAFRNTDLIVPACHDTASAIAGIRRDLDGAAYICSGTWSLVGTVIPSPITTSAAMDAGFTNQGAAAGGFCFHTNVNGMWILKQCLNVWRRDGRPWELPALIRQAAEREDFPGIVNVDAAPLLLDDDMPVRLNEQLRLNGFTTIEDIPGNEPLFARTIFESLAARYASVLRSLEQIMSKPIRRIHILGGGSLNQLLTRLTAEHTGLPVETGSVESSTLGNFAVQLAASESLGGPLRADAVRRWASRLAENCDRAQAASIV